VLLLLLGVFLWQRTVFPPWMCDLVLNQVGAHYFRTGEYEWMYAPVSQFDAWHEHSLPIAEHLGNDGDLLPFLYPPFVAALLSPFAEVPAVHWRNTVFAINILLLFIFAYLIPKLCRAGLSIRSFLWALALALLCYPMARATKLGQIVPLLAAMTWMALLLMRSGRTWIAGILLGIIGAVKLFPLVLIALPLLDRRFKMASISLGTAISIYVVSLLAIGLKVHLYWWEAMREFGSLVYSFIGNQSLLAWISRVFFGHGAIEEAYIAIPGMPFFTALFVIIFGGVTILALLKMRGQLTTDRLALSSGLVLATVMLTVPNAWEHYWIFVLPSLGWAIYETARRRDARFWEIWLGVASFFFLMKLTRFGYADTLLSQAMSGSQTFGMLLLWIWFVRRAWRDQRRFHVFQTA
jgi:hypothetical protein